MAFKDELVRCAACGKTFVFTVREQRARAERGLSTEPPAFCEECRGADVRLAETGAAVADRDAPSSELAPPSGQARPASRPEGRSRPPESRSPRGRDGARGTGQRGATGGRPDRGRRPERGPAGRGGSRGPQRRPRTTRPTQTELRVRHLGTVKWFDQDRGFGFIAQEDGDEVFVHHSGIIVPGVRELKEGQPVEYEIEHTSRGIQAVDVVPLA
jgi:CspA family cold shock protein